MLLHQSSAELDLVAQTCPESCEIWREVVVEKASVPCSSAPCLSQLMAVGLGCESCPHLLDDKRGSKHFNGQP